MPKRKLDLETALDIQKAIFWFMAHAYVADALGLYDNDKKLQLAHILEQSGVEVSWRDQARDDLGIDDAFVQGVYGLCRECGRSPRQALTFILRGLGCDLTEQSLQELLG